MFKVESSSKLKIWNQSIACCNWNGVTCDSEGHVIGLDLSAEYIYGGFDNTSSLFGLQHLQKVNLAFYNFDSSLPSAFNKLEKLTYLNSTDAIFVGKIPIEISQLTISHQNLQKLVQNLTNLRQLYLDGVSISTKGHEWINALLPLRDLHELSMSNCGLLRPLDSSLTRLENLSIIILDENYFSSPVPETFANFKNLTTLSLAFCALSGTFPLKIFQIGTLSVIDLFSNKNLHGSFPNDSLSESLHRIRVSDTNFSGALPSSIGNLRHLSELDLSVCQFNGTLPNSLTNLTHLSHLDLSSNKFTGHIPFLDIKRLRNLVTIYLSNNSINGIIPSFLFRLPLLQELLLSFNQFSILEEFTIMSSSLNILDLSSNDLSGPFPISIVQLGSLYSLDLSSNKFNESLQLDKLFELKNLTSLYLSYNNLSINGNGSNVDLSSIPNFDVLRLASCNLKMIPSFLINQSGLIILDLSDNQIHGIVPNWIWKLPYLQVLNISHNFFTDLEGPMQNLTSIWILDLHNNQLRGSIPVFPKSSDYLDYSTNNFSVIPQDIGNYLSSTKFLSLSNNNLQGNFPHSLCKASNIQVLDISFNKISGTISPCLMTMTRTLEALNLRKNNLSGPIPDMFPPSCALRTLNFHENLLHGPIPKSLSHCSY